MSIWTPASRRPTWANGRTTSDPGSAYRNGPTGSSTKASGSTTRSTVTALRPSEQLPLEEKPKWRTCPPNTRERISKSPKQLPSSSPPNSSNL
ncbi:unnamed protein product, partial [Nesidiocoris tenuis]